MLGFFSPDDPTRRRQEEREFAVVVADEYQGKGLGAKLTDMLINVAEEKGLERVYGIILTDNYRMIRFCEALGFETRTEEGNVVAEMKLR